jgi:hypothetical protein
MHPEAAFLEAALPEPLTLLHQQLLPYSVGHEIILRRLKSPFIFGQTYSKEALAGKLFSAVHVCCHTYDECVTTLRNPHLEENFARWRNLCGRFDPAPVTAAFVNYLAAGRSCPEYVRKSIGQSFRPGAPFILCLLQVLQGELGFSRSEALACPFGLAQWHYCAFWESQGRIRIHDLRSIRARAADLGLQPLRFNGA